MLLAFEMKKRGDGGGDYDGRFVQSCLVVDFRRLEAGHLHSSLSKSPIQGTRKKRMVEMRKW